MSNVLIVYGSTTGNTADIAEYLGGRLRAAGHVADVRDAADVSPDGLCEGRDVALFGCSAWGTDEVELQTDFEPLFEAFDRIGVKGVKTACFASGDSSFEHFCGAVDVIEARLNELGGIQILVNNAGITKDRLEARRQSLVERERRGRLGQPAAGGSLTTFFYANILKMKFNYNRLWAV